MNADYSEVDTEWQQLVASYNFGHSIAKLHQLYKTREAMKDQLEQVTQAIDLHRAALPEEIVSLYDRHRTVEALKGSKQ